MEEGTDSGLRRGRMISMKGLIAIAGFGAGVRVLLAIILQIEAELIETKLWVKGLWQNDPRNHDTTHLP